MASLYDVIRQAVREVAATAAAKAIQQIIWTIAEGDWPDKFTLLNRYVRTGAKPNGWPTS